MAEDSDCSRGGCSHRGRLHGRRGPKGQLPAQRQLSGGAGRRQDLTLSVTGTATLMPADSYNVTTLISGEVVSAPFEEDDQVEKGDLLFTLDSSDAQNNVDRANISVSQAQLAYQQAKRG